MNDGKRNVIWHVASLTKFNRDDVALEYVKDSFDISDEENEENSSSNRTSYYPLKDKIETFDDSCMESSTSTSTTTTTTRRSRTKVVIQDENNDNNNTNIEIWKYGEVLDWIESRRSWMMNDDVKRVGLCISQGPYLALSVLLTHAFGKTMIPLDVQNEGMERWKLMDEHVKPHLYLTYGIHDTQTVQQWKRNPHTPVLNLQDHPPSSSSLNTFNDYETNANKNKASPSLDDDNGLHHLCFTSGTTGGVPKCCMGSHDAIWNYCIEKNAVHKITTTTNSHTSSSKVLLASSLAFDPCLSDILATFLAQATLVLWNRTNHTLCQTIAQHSITHVLTTPTLWNTTTHNNHNDDWQKSLQVVALGGEFIPSTITSSIQNRHHKNHQSYLYVTYGVTEACVYQTFGPYQPPPIPIKNDNDALSFSTNPSLGGQSVGLSIPGNEIYIIKHNEDNNEEENYNNNCHFFLPKDQIGQVVLSGTQVKPPHIGYYHHDTHNCKNHQKINDNPFFQMNHKWYYKTGDLGYIHHNNNQLYLLGRIHSGSNGARQIKHLGVRIELSDIEAALTTTSIHTSTLYYALSSSTLFTACRVITYQPLTISTTNNHHGSTNKQKHQQRIAAYLVPSSSLANELLSQLDSQHNNKIGADNQSHKQHYHVLPTNSPLRWYLQKLCQLRVVQKCTPHDFIIIMNKQYLPTTRTGKCDDSTLQSWIQQYHQHASTDDNNHGLAPMLKDYGTTGFLVDQEIVRLLHISKASGITIKTTDHFITSLGGDSLTALLLVRALYAHYAQVQNSRYLLDDNHDNNNSLPHFLNVCYLLQLPTLEQYIHHLDKHWKNHQDLQNQITTIKQTDVKSDLKKFESTDQKESTTNTIQKDHDLDTHNNEYTSIYHKMLMDSISTDQTITGCALLSLLPKLSTDDSGIHDDSPNSGKKKAPRMGKLSQNDSNTRRQLFQTNPLHLACTKGNPDIVRAIGIYGPSKWAKTPNASGTFAIHLICNNSNKKDTFNSKKKEQENRLECLKYMLSPMSPFRVPVTIRDASKQTLVHAAARGGHDLLLQYLLSDSDNTNANLSRLINSHDRWFRTPLHWTILNKHYECTKTLLEKENCLIEPPKPSDKVAKRFTSGKIETPMDIAKRLVHEEEQGLPRPSSFVHPYDVSKNDKNCEKDTTATPTTVGPENSIARDILDLLIQHCNRHRSMQKT